MGLPEVGRYQGVPTEWARVRNFIKHFASTLHGAASGVDIEKVVGHKGVGGDEAALGGVCMEGPCMKERRLGRGETFEER